MRIWKVEREDHLINCLRPGEPCETGFDLLKKKQNDLDDILPLEAGDDDEDFHNIDELDLSDEEIDVE